MHRALATYTLPKDDAAQLLQKYDALIDRCARRICTRIGIDSFFDDLWSAGALGLVEAAQRFDATRGANFETFVTHRVRGAMLDELRRMDHLPRRLRAQTDQVQKARHKLSAKLGRTASSDEVAVELDLDATYLADIQAIAEAPVPLDSVVGTLGGEARMDETIDRVRMAKALSGGVGKLGERLQLVLSLHYVEGLSYREIGKMLDISEPRVCQLHADALKQLRRFLNADERQGPAQIHERKGEGP